MSIELLLMALCASAVLVIIGDEVWGHYFKKIPVSSFRGFQRLSKFESPELVSKWEARGMTRHAYVRVNKNQLRAINRELKRRNSIDL